MSDSQSLKTSGETALVDGRIDEGGVVVTGARPRRPLDPGRLGVYTVLGGATGSVPLPWLPDALARRVRGALVQDIARRHGLSLPREAREVLCEPSGTEGPRGMFAQVSTFVGKKVLARFGPLGVFSPVKAALETYLLGHLFHRYLESPRRSDSRRVDVVEARRVRHAIDQAILAALTVETLSPPESKEALPGDDRDAITEVIDRVLSKTASVPAWLLVRVETAFDERLLRVEV